jgi:hypothetical protein
MFEMYRAEEGDTLHSLADSCNAFVEDVYDINATGTSFGSSATHRNEVGLAENTSGPESDHPPNQKEMVKLVGFKLARGEKGAPPEHSGEKDCVCSICKVKKGTICRLFRAVKSIQGKIPTTLFPFEIRNVIIDVLHSIMRITESLLWALMCSVSLHPHMSPSVPCSVYVLLVLPLVGFDSEVCWPCVYASMCPFVGV